MGMPRHLDLEALVEVISSITLISGSRVALNYFWLPACWVIPSRKPRAHKKRKPSAGHFVHITSSENLQ